MTDRDPLALAREALGGTPAWLVGGALRDRLLGRPTDDLDVVVDGPVKEAARALGRLARAAAFPLSDAFGVWRGVARDHPRRGGPPTANGPGRAEGLAGR